MRYLLLLLLLLPLQGAHPEPVDQLDGTDWNSWTIQQRYDYALGYSSAMFFAAVAIYERTEGKLNEPITADIYYLFQSVKELDVDDMAREMTRFYSNENNTDVALLSAPFKIESVRYNPSQNKGVSYK